MTTYSKIHRKELYYSGRVQGVGFRYTTISIAKRYEVVGFVQNLPDGRVHLAVEGKQGDVDRFLAELAAELSFNIHDCQSQSLESTGEFVRFEIRYSS